LTLRLGLDGRFLTGDYPGIGRYTYELARALGRRGDVDVRLLAGRVGPRFPHAALRDAGVTLVATDIPVRSLREQLALPRLLRRLGCEVFHAPYLVTALRPPCPLVVTVHDALPWRRPELLPRPSAAWGLRLAWTLVRRRARVITVSEASRRELAGRDPAVDAVVIPEAPAPEFRPAPAADVEALRRRLGFAGPYLLHVGSHRPHKNLGRLLDAWAVVRERPAALSSLVFAGRPEPRDRELAKKLRHRDDVVVLGEVGESDLPALYTGATAFVLPSLVEGFGLPVLEAMACGVPVACSRTSSLPEVAGDAAVYFEPSDVGAIVEALARLEDAGLRTDLGERGRRRAASFTWDETARRTLEVYREVTAANRRDSLGRQKSQEG